MTVAVINQFYEKFTHPPQTSIEVKTPSFHHSERQKDRKTEKQKNRKTKTSILGKTASFYRFQKYRKTKRKRVRGKERVRKREADKEKGTRKI